MHSRVHALNAAAKLPKHTLSVLSPHLGDKQFTWSPDDDASVAVAEREFANAKADGMVGVRVNSEGQGGEVINTFDPTADAVVMTPQIVGG